jgi:hypothetical protein
LVDNITVWLYNNYIDSKKHIAKYAVYKEQKMTKTQTWYGYTEQEYNELVKQPGEPEWCDLQLSPEDAEIAAVVDDIDAMLAEMFGEAYN